MLLREYAFQIAVEGFGYAGAAKFGALLLFMGLLVPGVDSEGTFCKGSHVFLLLRNM
jgi:hypothetical protein